VNASAGLNRLAGFEVAKRLRVTLQGPIRNFGCLINQLDRLRVPAIAGGTRRRTDGEESRRSPAIEPNHPGAENGNCGQPAADGDPEPAMFGAVCERQGT